MYTFKKAERLKQKKIIERLFKEGSSVTIYPFKVIWLETALDVPFPAQLLVTVSKKNIKKAIGRNRIKRYMREAWRQEKNRFYDFLTSRGKQCAVGMIFIGNSEDSPSLVREKIKMTVDRLIKALDDH
jgi:ribonuclease P protein component